MKKTIFTISVCLLASGLAHAGNEQITTAMDDMDAKHKTCLERISKDSDLAYEEAMIWQSKGGGRRARHCVAMALFALGHEDEAAFRLEKLARSPDGGNTALRVGYYAESAGMWLKAGLPRKAYDAASAGLKLDKTDVNLRIERARVYVALGKPEYAETDLSSVLAFSPNEARALRYRADVRLRLKKLALAKADIDRSVRLNIKDIDSLLVRGQINEAIRISKMHKTAHKKGQK
ncbi:MAG: hypothetical protein V3U57_00385 [Robiginitomaculum sp.]